jgi:hypothetical protein
MVVTRTSPIYPAAVKGKPRLPGLSSMERTGIEPVTSSLQIPRTDLRRTPSNAQLRMDA